MPKLCKRLLLDAKIALLLHNVDDLALVHKNLLQVIFLNGECDVLHLDTDSQASCSLLGTRISLTLLLLLRCFLDVVETKTVVGDVFAPSFGAVIHFLDPLLPLDLEPLSTVIVLLLHFINDGCKVILVW